MAGAEGLRRVRLILDDAKDARQAVVVSAMSGVTDGLIELVELAKARDGRYETSLDAIEKRHLEAARDLLESKSEGELTLAIARDRRDIADVLRAAWLGRHASELTVELVSGYGELWSAQLLNTFLRCSSDSTWLDAREVLVVREGELGPLVDWDESRSRLERWLSGHAEPRVVITGFIASTPEGAPTTLKRNGSDFSASIFGALLGADTVTIWTDVDGILSADPRRVPEARVLDELSYHEAMELAYFGAKVVHPRTMAPAVASGIPILIRNTFHPEAKGTRIQSRASGSADGPDGPLKGLSTVDGVTLVNVEGSGMIGVPGVAQRVFAALAQKKVSVILISQASSEHSICFAVPDAEGELARATVERAFARELDEKMIQRVELVPRCSILAAVGDAMRERPGVAARFFRALGDAGVNVRAIAQGSSERNISAVIDGKDSTRSLRAVHASFYLSEQTLSMGVIGTGTIGRAFLGQLRSQTAALHRDSRIDLRVRGVASSKQMILSDPALELRELSATIERDGRPADLDAFGDWIQADYLPHAVLVDCTASEAVASRYEGWLRRGIHVITPNKKAGSGRLDVYRELQRLGRETGAHYLYEATVGAGLPIITTLRDLVRTGDRVLRIEGILSGTLSYIFSTLSPGGSFSATVSKARELGYTEPDPREDLSGMDVARKLVILAREMGLGLELEDVEVESLVPAELSSEPSVLSFMRALPSFDGPMAAHMKDAEREGKVLRYVGVVESSGRATVSLVRREKDHPFARIQGSDNILAFTTKRYHDRPLIVQGPGAGPEVTAGGVFADLLRLAHYLGAPSS